MSHYELESRDIPQSTHELILKDWTEFWSKLGEFNEQNELREAGALVLHPISVELLEDRAMSLMAYIVHIRAEDMPEDTLFPIMNESRVWLAERGEEELKELARFALEGEKRTMRRILGEEEPFQYLGKDAQNEAILAAQGLEVIRSPEWEAYLSDENGLRRVFIHFQRWGMPSDELEKWRQHVIQKKAFDPLGAF